MLNKFSKTLLFILSYSPLFLIFVILDFDTTEELFFKNPLFSYLIISTLILSFLLVIIIINYVFKNLLLYDKTGIIGQVENNNSEILAYLFAYVIPFLGIDSNKKIIVIIILLFVTYIIYIRSDLIKYNIVLLLLKYDTVKINLEDDSEIFLIKKYNRLLKKGDKINYVKISENLYFLK